VWRFVPSVAEEEEPETVDSEHDGHRGGLYLKRAQLYIEFFLGPVWAQNWFL